MGKFESECKNIIEEGKLFNSLLAAGLLGLGLTDVNAKDHKLPEIPQVVNHNLPEIPQTNFEDFARNNPQSVKDINKQKSTKNKQAVKKSKKNVVMPAFAVDNNVTIDNITKMDEKTTELARVIYAENGTVTSADAIKHVAAVINNRIGNKAFNGGKLKTAWDVISNPREFNTYKNDKCISWKNFSPTMNEAAMLASTCAYMLMNGKNNVFKQIDSESVYFHDGSITMPNVWKKFYDVTLTHDIDGLKQRMLFYKISPKK